MLTEPPAAPAQTHGRAGRNLPAAIGIGVGLGAYVVLSLVYLKPAFVALVAVALVLAAVELHEELKKQGMTSAIIPIAIGSVAIAFGSYFAGRQEPVIFSTTSVLLASLALTVLASLIWRMPKECCRLRPRRSRQHADHWIRAATRLVRSVDARRGAGQCSTGDLPVDRGDERHRRLCGRSAVRQTSDGAQDQPQEVVEGLAGSLVFGTAAGVCMAVFLLDVPFWVGIVLGVSLVAAGTCGDLIESIIKRDLGIKDMSSFLPGHGGVMDRLDSLLIAAPVAWLIMYLLVPGG